jgi:type I restriction enzyme S subunit
MATPKLRFKEFNDNWLIVDIQSLVDEKIIDKPMDGNHGEIHPTSADYVEDGIPFVMATDVIDGKVYLDKSKKIKKSQADGLRKGFSLEGDILLTHKATIGNVAKVPELKTPYIMLTPQVTYYRVLNKDKLNQDFIKSTFEAPVFQNALLALCTGATRLYIGISEQRKLPFSYPSKKEQTKIASFLSAVDEKISQLTQKHQLLSQYKQGMMQKLFSQQIRFKADDGSEFGEWKSVFLGDISKPQQWKTISSSELTEIGYPVFGANGYIGFYPKYNHINETIAVTCRGATCGEVTLVKAKCYITGNAMSIDEINENEHSTLYIYYALCFRGFKDVISGSAQPQIVGNAIRKVTFQIPCLEEQTKIANFLSAIDQKIEVTEKQIEQAKQWKKGLLQQMFV